MVSFLFALAMAATPPEGPSETLVRLTVDPMKAPKPALRIQLLPELREMKPGNPIAAYLGVLLDQDNTTADSNLGPAALRRADRAARLDKPDWQILTKVQTEGIMLLLPDLQKMREIAAALQARFRDEVAQRRFDDALITAKTMLAMSRHVGDHPTLIGNLVGVAIGMISLAPLEEMLETPGCPNLYWALTDLPHPFISIDSGLAGERVLIHAEFRELSRTKPMTPAQIRKMIDHIDEIRKYEADRIKLTTKQWIAVRTRDEKYLAAARVRLSESGLAAEDLAKFPAEQIVLLDEVREFETRRDDEAKFAKLPTWEYEAHIAKHVRTTEPALVELFLPAMRKVRLAQGRIEQKIAMLRTVEALRIFAAENAGKLPGKLADLSVPVPVDPMTGKPFRYELVGGLAHIRGTAPADFANVPSFNLHYEIGIRKAP